MKSNGQIRVEWILLAIIGVVCAVLSFLQYRWTGDLSRAEPVLLRAGLNDQVRGLARSFNDEIHESCTALVPDADEIQRLGTVEAHRVQYGQWLSSHDRSLFTRIGIAAPDHGLLNLYGIDSNGQVAAMPAPKQWEPLLGRMTDRMKGSGRPPNAASDSNLIEIPVFDSGGSELEWVIFELDEKYLRGTVLPRLINTYLNPDREAVYDVSVSWAGSGDVIFSTRRDGSSVATNADATAGLFSAEMGSGPPRGHGRFQDEARSARWTIAVRHRAGSLDAAVAQARTRNLAASLMLVALLGGAAWALARYTARSRRLAEMQFQFAAGVSHDFRTPLTAIRGAAFNLVAGVIQEPAAIQRYLKLILRNAEELTSMIENVLAFSASMNAGTEGKYEAFSVGDLLKQAVAATTPEIEQSGCRLELTVAPGLPPVDGDAVAMQLVFRNLISNAVRHGAGGKWIGVSAARFDGGVEIRVCDHGPGVPAAERERIFEPFYRGDQTRARQIPGTGLGLSLARKTVERHHGTIQVSGPAGGGAEFTVRLPGLT